MKRGRRIAVIVVAVVLFVAPMALDALTVKIARSALSNSGFGRAHTATPADFALTYGDVEFHADGLRLAGWWIPADAMAPHRDTTVILVHGHSAEMGKIVRHWGPNVHAAGYNILTFDLRNHGASDDDRWGYVSYGTNESHDVLAAMEYVRSHADSLGVDPDRIILYGESMGSSAVFLAAATHPPGLLGVISDSGFASFEFQARLDGEALGYPSFLVSMVLDRMDELAPAPPSQANGIVAVEQLDVPLLLAHCIDDGRLDVASQDVLIQHSHAPSTIVWREACASARPDSDHHVDGWRFSGYNTTVTKFLDSL